MQVVHLTSTPGKKGHALIRPKSRPVPRERRLEAKAQAVGLSLGEFKIKLKELLLLLPVVTKATLLSLDAESLQDLMEDVPFLGTTLAEARSRLRWISVGAEAALEDLPLFKSCQLRYLEMGRATKFLWQHPELLSSRHWPSFTNSLPVASLLGHSKGVTAVAITPDSRQAVSNSHDGTLQVWGLQQHSCVVTLRRQDVLLRDHAMAVSPDGRRLVSANAAGVLEVWDLQKLTCVTTPTHTGVVSIASVAIPRTAAMP